MMEALFRKKSVLSGESRTPSGLLACLSAWDLTFLGIGAIIGAGIFVLTGIAAATAAGPAIVLSFIVAGLACAFAAFSYAELAASVGGCGSAYHYTYIGIGEFVAWTIGWDLLLEYALSVSAVAVGWSRYVGTLFESLGMAIPYYLLKSPAEGGVINLLSVLIVLFVSLLLIVGVKASARFNTVMVLLKLTVIALFIVIASMNVKPINWVPFMPFGWSGVMSGAALIFFAYIGFDALSTAAEEVKRPQHDLPIGIIASLLICTLLYIVVSGLLTGIMPYHELNVASPISYSLLALHYPKSAAMVAVGAIAGLTTVILVMYYGCTRVFLAISRDGLLPVAFSAIHPTRHTPVRIIVFTGIVISLIAGLMPISELAELVNIGTLFAFVVVCISVIILRKTRPSLMRPFKTPFYPWIPLLGIAFCCYLMFSLPVVTWLRFITWMSLGLLIYFQYSRHNSMLVAD